MTRLALWHRSLSTGARVYRRTPVVLRRPEPWFRLGAALFVLWFGGMFLALGLLSRRGFTDATVAFPPFLFLLTRRYRAGLGLMAGMLGLGQVVTIAAVV